MNDKLQKMREKQPGEWGGAKSETPNRKPPQGGSGTAPPQVPDKAPKKAKAPKEPKPTVRYICGHDKPVADLQGQHCPQCRNEARRRKAQARIEKFRTKPTPPERGRLPAGAEFHVAYSAEKQTWGGTLFIPDGLNSLKFTGSGSGVFRLLKELDDQYRSYLKAQQPAQ